MEEPLTTKQDQKEQQHLERFYCPFFYLKCSMFTRRNVRILKFLAIVGVFMYVVVSLDL